MLQGIRAIYFDLDDTLCGYWTASKEGLQQAFARHPIGSLTTPEAVGIWGKAFREFCPKIKESSWYEQYLSSGEPTRTELMRRALAEAGCPNEEHAARLSEAYMLARDAALALFPGSLNTLNQLKSKFPLGLITNGPADIQRQEIQTLGIESFFQYIFIEGEMGEGKPKPSVFARALDAVEVEAHETVFVGNSFHHDIEPAIRCGWKTIWIRQDTDVPPSARPGMERPEERPEGSPEPDFEISRIEQVIDLCLP